MRDPKRITEILTLIDEIWQFDKDMRFLQLIYCLQSGYAYENDGHGRIELVEPDGFTNTGYDLFNVEDDEFILFLKKHLNKLIEQKNKV